MMRLCRRSLEIPARYRSQQPFLLLFCRAFFLFETPRLNQCGQRIYWTFTQQNQRGCALKKNVFSVSLAPRASYFFSAKGAFSYEPGASPQDPIISVNER